MGPPSTRFYNALHRHSIRHGVLAMLLFALVALLANILLPYLIPATPQRPNKPLANFQSKPILKNATGPANASKLPPAARTRKRSLLPLTLPRAWSYAHIFMALCLLGTTACDSFIAAASFVGLLGIPWTLTQWAPSAILGAEIAGTPPFSPPSPRLSPSPSNPSPTVDPEKDLDDVDDAEQTENQSNTAGTIMRVHNIAIALPQIISAILSSAIFALFRALGLGDTEAVAWVLRVGVVAALGAGFVAAGIE